MTKLFCSKAFLLGLPVLPLLVLLGAFDAPHDTSGLEAGLTLIGLAVLGIPVAVVLSLLPFLGNAIAPSENWAVWKRRSLFPWGMLVGHWFFLIAMSLPFLPF